MLYVHRWLYRVHSNEPGGAPVNPIDLVGLAVTVWVVLAQYLDSKSR